MNERIKELAKQADGVFIHKLITGAKQYTFLEKDLEKFAELIVKECLEACSRANEIRHFVPPTQEQVVLSCMREIETTFRS
jgi:hypothetical protein